MTDRTAWVGWVVLGAAMMALLGTFQVLAGVVAPFNGTCFVARHQDLVVSVSHDTWSWAHLIGALVIYAVTAHGSEIKNLPVQPPGPGLRRDSRHVPPGSRRPAAHRQVEAGLGQPSPG